MISIHHELHKTRNIIDEIISSADLTKKIEQIAKVCEIALRGGHKIIFCGNGGSAADSQHLAAELVGKLNFDRSGLAAIALTTDTSSLTAIGNDYGFENVFSRQLAAVGQKGDVLIAISTSGNSANIINAITVARARGITTIGKTGERGGKMADICDITIKVPSDSTQKIQECHMILGHIYCGMIEERMFK